MKHIQKDCLWSCHKQIQIFYKSVNDFFFPNLNFFSFKNFTRNKQTKNLLVFVDVTNTSNNCYFIAFYFRFGNHKHSNKDQKGTIFSFFCNLMVSKLPSLKLTSGTFILPSHHKIYQILFNFYVWNELEKLNLTLIFWWKEHT